MKKSLLALCLTVFIACPLLGYQPDEEYRLYLAFTAGGAFFSSPDSGSDYHILSSYGIDSGYTVGFRLGYHIAHLWDLETSFHYSPTHLRIRSSIFVPTGQQNSIYQEWVHKLDVLSFNTNLTYYFVQKRVQPFLTAGMGGVIFSRAETSRTNFAVNLGGGVKFHPKQRLRISFDIKDLIIFNQYLFLETRNNLALTLAAEFLF